MPFKNETLNWEELRLFSLVAHAGGLAGATRSTGISAATFSRRIAHLEESLNLTLFERAQAGYTLTSYGEELHAYVLEMEAKSHLIRSWRNRLNSRPIVRITAGAWTSLFLARHLDDLSDRDNGPRIELLSGANFFNLSRREADIGIRDKKPDQQGLLRRRIGTVSFAIFAAASYIEKNSQANTEERFERCHWIALSSTGMTGMSPSSIWLRERIGDSPRLTCNSPQSVVEAAASGSGLCILPSFIGASDSRLTCCSESIEALTYNQWQVSHSESRRQSHIAGVSRNLSDLFRRNLALFA